MNTLKTSLTVILNGITLLASSCALASSNSSEQLIVGYDVQHDISRPLSEMNATPILSGSPKIIPVLHTPPLATFGNDQPAFALSPDTSAEPTPVNPFAITIHSFQGIGVGLGSYQPDLAPPDTNGAAGLKQYVQWANADFGVFDKVTGIIAAGFPKPGNALFSGFGGLCETTNNGDGVVKYDQLADRWVITQFAFSDPTNGPFFQCIAVSTSPDATGTYSRYAFQFDSFNDYGKFGLWPDAYYMTFNMFGPVSTGPRACALDRNAMLAGKAAAIQCIQLSFNNTGSILPADLDGPLLPATGNPEYLMSLQPPNALQLYQFHVDFVNANNTKLTGPTVIPVTAFTEACSATSGDSCVSQPNTTTQLDTLSDRLMHRLAYRQFADHGAVVITHTIKGASSASSIRWYEIRFVNGSTKPAVFQHGTHSILNTSAFMGSIALDKLGNIAYGYSESSGAVFPTISISARVPGDPPGTVSVNRNVILGTGSQVNGLTRWGDYTAMTIDPADDCTFWYTNEYIKTTGSFNWSTYIANFKMPGC